MTLVTPNQPIHPKFDERISVKVEGQLPAFVKQDHETFVAFMEAYYEYMEQQGKPYEIIGNLNNYVNLDKTTDEFLNYFKKQFAEDIPEAIFQNANKPFVLKHIRDFYRAKGSEKSFQFLFRLLYKEEISFYFPGSDMLRTSDGNYGKSEILRVIDTSTSEDVFEFTGKKITGQTSGATAIVENVLKENIGRFVVSTIFLSGVIGTFQSNEIVSDGEHDFLTGGMVIDTEVTKAGCGYKVGDRVPLTNEGLGSSAFIRIKEITTGSVKDTIITNGGTGYKIGDKLDIDNTDKLAIDGRTASVIVKEVDNNGAILKLEIENTGRGYIGIPTMSGGSGEGAILSFVEPGTNISGVKSLDVIDNGFGYTTPPTLDFTGLGNDVEKAEATVIIGGYENEFGLKFTGTDGFLSSDKYLQDSFYYQLFSYVITSGQTIDKWRDTIKRTVHPAGLALFGNFQIISNISMPLQLTGLSEPFDERYTIIFHDGTIEPPVTLDLKIETCDDEQNIRVFFPNEDYNNNNGLFSVEDRDPENWGFITEPIEIDPSRNVFIASEDYQFINQPTFYIAPTKCQTYEQDLGIQKLTTLGGFDDHLFTNIVDTRFQDDGLVSEAGTETEDYGWVFQDPEGVTQLRLGPLRRTIDRQKFNKQGGFSQTIDTVKGLQDITVTNQGSGYVAVPNVTISASPTGGTQATATAVLGTGVDSDKVVSITINNIGSGYGAPPGYPNFVSVTIDPPTSGVQAEATAVFLRASGTIIENFKDHQIFQFVLFAGLKTRIVTNSTITQYSTGTEANTLPPPV